jgi:hypothetical protein
MADQKGDLMGEYANYNGSEIKIGTCEDMFYLRADQAHTVTPIAGSVDPIRDAEELRFRFPFPDEDSIEPGHFEDHDRGVKIPEWRIPEDWGGHSIVQFVATQGYNLCVPCPEGTEQIEGLKIHRNGWNGGPVVKQQRYVGGLLLTVVGCGACGAAWRLPTIEAATPVIEAFRAEAERQEWRRKYDHDRDEFADDFGWEPAHLEAHREFLLAIAARIFAGYCLNTEAREEVTA